MINIQLNKDYKIKSDAHNFILYRRQDKFKRPKHLQDKMENDGDNEKEAGYLIIGYYPDMDWLYHELVDLEIKLSDAKTFTELINMIKELNSSLRNGKITNN